MEIAIIGSAASIHVVKWVNYFKNEGVDILVFSFDKKSMLLHNDIEVRLIPSFKNFPLFLKFVIQTRKYLKERSEILVHIHSLGSYGLFGLMLGRKNLISTPWGSDILLLGKNLLKRLVIYILIRKSTLFTCDGKLIEEKLISKGVSSENIEIINFGVDTEKFKKSNSHLLRKKLQISEETRVVISTRSFEPIYDLETLVLAVDELINRSKLDLKLILIGEGSTKNQIQTLVSEKKLSKNIFFIGRVDNSLLPSYLNIADIYVSTSLSDAGIAASTAEAMACELICLISNVRENSSWVEEGVSGFLFGPRNFQELAFKINYVCQNHIQLSDIGVTARKTIIKRNDYYGEMAKMHKIYLKLVKNV
jgi:glycosyltransferase involved in cell wall biosynthesis